MKAGPDLEPVESEWIPIRWRRHVYAPGCAESLSQFIRDMLERHGGACTRGETLSAIRARPTMSERLDAGQGLSRLLQNMKHSGFVTLEGEIVRRTIRRVGWRSP